MGRWDIKVRSAVAVGWVALVCVTVLVGSRRDSQVDRILATAARQREELRLRAAEDILSALLGERETGLPDSYRFTVYVYAPDEQLLLPVFPEPYQGGSDVRAFRPGRGATGTAFDRKTLVLVTGEAVADATYGLTPEQQEHWGSYRSVVSTPIWVDGVEPIGVLSGISRSDEGIFEEPAAQARLREMADVIGVVLVNVSGEG